VSLAQHGTVPKEREKRLDAIPKPGRVHSMHFQWLIDDIFLKVLTSEMDYAIASEMYKKMYLFL